MPFSGYSDLDRLFASNLQAMIAASPSSITPFSGYRSIARQQQLWDASDRTGHMVAPPGHSQHNFGRAVDLRFADDAAKQFAHANAAQYGLTFPMSYEPWHIEPVGARSGFHATNPATVSGADDGRSPNPGLGDPWAGGRSVGDTGWMPSAGMDLGGRYSDVLSPHRPLPFEQGYGLPQVMQSMIGGTMRQDLRMGVAKRLFGSLLG